MCVSFTYINIPKVTVYNIANTISKMISSQNVSARTTELQQECPNAKLAKITPSNNPLQNNSKGKQDTHQKIATILKTSERDNSTFELNREALKFRGSHFGSSLKPQLKLIEESTMAKGSTEYTKEHSTTKRDDTKEVFCEKLQDFSGIPNRRLAKSQIIRNNLMRSYLQNESSYCTNNIQRIIFGKCPT